MSTSERSFYGLAAGDSFLVLGPPGTGKSHFASTICEIVPPERTLLVATKPRERLSHGYRKYGLDKTAELFCNEDWDPVLGNYQHDGFKRLMRRLAELRTDDSIDAVILDPGTDAGLLIRQHILGPHRAASPTDLNDPRAYYQQFSPTADTFVKRLVSLTYAASPKFVICTWHTQPPKEGDKEGSGVRYEGEVLPALEGSFRETLAGDFSNVVFSMLLQDTRRFDPQAKKSVTVPGGYMIQVRADETRHAKVAALEAFTDVTHLPNEFKELYERMIQT